MLLTPWQLIKMESYTFGDQENMVCWDEVIVSKIIKSQPI